jgi:hypothetical protein
VENAPHPKVHRNWHHPERAAHPPAVLRAAVIGTGFGPQSGWAVVYERHHVHVRSITTNTTTTPIHPGQPSRISHVETPIV